MTRYRCTECGWTCDAEPKGAIGYAHAHAEQHAGVRIIGFELPAWLLPVANPERLDEYIKEVARCHFCGREWEAAVVDGFDLSTEDEYYPRMKPVCPEHAGGCR